MCKIWGLQSTIKAISSSDHYSCLEGLSRTVTFPLPYLNYHLHQFIFLKVLPISFPQIEASDWVVL